LHVNVTGLRSVDDFVQNRAPPYARGRTAKHSAACPIYDKLHLGNNVQIDYRWSGGSEDDTRKYAAELVALAPDVIFASGSAAVEPLRRATRSVPIVFSLVPDPVGAGFVESLARPGGNSTSFSPWEYGMGAKWLELLKQIAPGVTRVAVHDSPAETPSAPRQPST
jgi:ABC-type uncharacterized transport system substrate-binding protein